MREGGIAFVGGTLLGGGLDISPIIAAEKPQAWIVSSIGHDRLVAHRFALTSFGNINESAPSTPGLPAEYFATLRRKFSKRFS